MNALSHNYHAHLFKLYFFSFFFFDIAINRTRTVCSTCSSHLAIILSRSTSTSLMCKRVIMSSKYKLDLDKSWNDINCENKFISHSRVYLFCYCQRPQAKTLWGWSNCPKRKEHTHTNTQTRYSKAKGSLEKTRRMRMKKRKWKTFACHCNCEGCVSNV